MLQQGGLLLLLLFFLFYFMFILYQLYKKAYAPVYTFSASNYFILKIVCFLNIHKRVESSSLFFQAIHFALRKSLQFFVKFSKSLAP